MKRVALSLAVGLVVALTGAAMHAQRPAPVPPAQSQEQLDAHWEAQLTAAKERRDGARVRVAAAEAELDRARHRKKPRGEALGQLETNLDHARGELAKAEDALPPLLEAARVAGVSPRVLLRFEPESE